MNINASIIDQRVVAIADEYSESLPGRDSERKKSAAFVLLCISTALELSLEEALEFLTEGGNDVGVDGMHIGEVDDGEFTVTLFQAKYKRKLDGESHFPENAVQKIVNIVGTLFDPNKEIELNEKIKPKVEEIRALVGKEGFIPTVRILLCNNGLSWNKQAQCIINNSGFDEERVVWKHLNHNSMLQILQKTKSVDEELRLSGKTVVEDLTYRRVLIGRISVKEIKRIFDTYGNRLLQRNIRRYLGLHANRVNKAIHETLLSKDSAENFYFYNNGITVVCDGFDYNALQEKNHIIQVKNLQIVNGGQTCRTIQETLEEYPNSANSAYLMIRIYQLADKHKEVIRRITYATNSQNPVELHDLRSNDDVQKNLEMGMKEFGYTYKRQREGSVSGHLVITSLTVAEAVLAIWRKKPHQAKCRRKEHFGKLYKEIFTNLNAAQAVLAVLIFRIVENVRKSSDLSNSYPFIPYASHYIAMLIGKELLDKHKIGIEDISHENFQALKADFEEDSKQYYTNAGFEIVTALALNYGERDISLQQLSATFRRGDLLERLQQP